MTDREGRRRAQLIEEAGAFTSRLERGAKTLAQLGPVSPGASARAVVHRRGGTTLYRYTPLAGAPAPQGSRVPLLLVYALVNRPYVADLQADRSLVRGLLARGQDVYLVDWGYPGPEDRSTGLDEYVDRCLREMVDVVRTRAGAPAINLLGICQGGTLSLCYAALHPDSVRGLVTMVTPVDFHTPDDLLHRWVRHLDIDLLVDTLGNVPGALLNGVFLSLKPLSLGGRKYLDALDDPEEAATFLRMERWIRDSPDQAGEAFRQFVKGLYQENRLVQDRFCIAGRPVRLAALRMPLLNVYATRDHIVPPAASLALGGLVASDDYSTLAFSGGHIGIYVSRRAQAEVAPGICDWLEARPTPLGA